MTDNSPATDELIAQIEADIKNGTMGEHHVVLSLIARIRAETAKNSGEVVACHCTLIEQDESCPVGYPSLLCDDCDGKGHVSNEPPLCWIYEDELPESLTTEAYNSLFPYSKLDGVRLFPVFGPANSRAEAIGAREEYPTPCQNCDGQGEQLIGGTIEHPNQIVCSQCNGTGKVLEPYQAPDVRRVIADTIGFNFEPNELQSVNAEDLLRLAGALLQQEGE